MDYSYLGLIAEYRIRLQMLRLAKVNGTPAGELEWYKRILKAKIRAKVNRMRASSEVVPPYKYHAHSVTPIVIDTSIPNTPLPSPVIVVATKEQPTSRKRKVGQVKMEL